MSYYKPHNLRKKIKQLISENHKLKIQNQNYKGENEISHLQQNEFEEKKQEYIRILQQKDQEIQQLKAQNKQCTKLIPQLYSKIHWYQYEIEKLQDQKLESDVNSLTITPTMNHQVVELKQKSKRKSDPDQNTNRNRNQNRNQNKNQNRNQNTKRQNNIRNRLKHKQSDQHRSYSRSRSRTETTKRQRPQRSGKYSKKCGGCHSPLQDEKVPVSWLLDVFEFKSINCAGRGCKKINLKKDEIVNFCQECQDSYCEDCYISKLKRTTITRIKHLSS